MWRDTYQIRLASCACASWSEFLDGYGVHNNGRRASRRSSFEWVPLRVVLLGTARDDRDFSWRKRRRCATSDKRGQISMLPSPTEAVWRHVLLHRHLSAQCADERAGASYFIVNSVCLSLWVTAFIKVEKLGKLGLFALSCSATPQIRQLSDKELENCQYCKI